MSPPHRPPVWSEWVRRQLELREWRNVDAARASELPSSAFTSWIRHGRDPDIPNLRKFAKAVGIPVPLVMIAAGYLTEADLEEVGVELPTMPVDEDEVIRNAASKTLTNELLSRIEQAAAEAKRDTEVAERLRQTDELEERRAQVTLMEPSALAKEDARRAQVRFASEEMTLEQLGLVDVQDEKGSRDWA